MALQILQYLRLTSACEPMQENVLLTSQAELLISDFGALESGVWRGQRTEGQQPNGTYHYCAPEQLMGKLPANKQINNHAVRR